MAKRPSTMTEHKRVVVSASFGGDSSQVTTKSPVTSDDDSGIDDGEALAQEGQSVLSTSPVTTGAVAQNQNSNNLPTLDTMPPAPSLNRSRSIDRLRGDSVADVAPPSPRSLAAAAAIGDSGFGTSSPVDVDRGCSESTSRKAHDGIMQGEDRHRDEAKTSDEVLFDVLVNTFEMAAVKRPLGEQSNNALCLFASDDTTFVLLSQASVGSFIPRKRVSRLTWESCRRHQRDTYRVSSLGSSHKASTVPCSRRFSSLEPQTGNSRHCLTHRGSIW